VTVRRLEHVSASTAYVVVASHQSNLDPMVHLRTLPLSLRILVKRELFRIWLLGRAMHAIGMIEVDRDSPDFGQIDQAGARSLAAGHSPGWVTGTSYGIIAPLTIGATLVTDAGDFEARRWYQVLADHKVAVWYTAPTAINRRGRSLVIGAKVPT
jgi:hypothetical protein